MLALTALFLGALIGAALVRRRRRVEPDGGPGHGHVHLDPHEPLIDDSFTIGPRA